MRSLPLLLVFSFALCASAQVAEGSLQFPKVNAKGTLTAEYMPPPVPSSVFGLDSAGSLKAFALGEGIGIVGGALVIEGAGGDWEDITGTPTTLAGYGITDPVVLTSGAYSNPAWITALAWSKLTGTPTTLAGYGITDPVVLTSGAYSNPAWITALAWSKLTSTPTTLAGYGITDPVVLTSGSYSNPAWITALAWSKITSTPTTLAGYGITDAITATAANAAFQPASAGLSALAEVGTEEWGLGLLGLADGDALRTYAEFGALSVLNSVASTDITNGTILNEDIHAAAAIAVSKISGLGSLATLSTVGSSQITDGAITNADVSASAAIAISKIDGLQGVLDAKANNLHAHLVSEVTGFNTNRLFGTGGTFAVGQEISVSSPLSLSAGTLSVGNIDLASKVTGTLPPSNGGTGITSLGSGVSTLLGSFTASNANAALSGDDFAFVGAANVFSDVQRVKSLKLNSSDGVHLRDGAEVNGDPNQKGRLVWGHDAYGVSTQVEGYVTTLTKMLAGNGFGSPYYRGELVIPAADQWDMRSGTNPVTVSFYNTWTSGTNFEAASIFWHSNVANYKPVAGVDGGTVRTQRFWLTGTVWIGAGGGTPEGVETGGVGSIYTDTNSGSVYRKTSGSGNTGWVTP